MCYTSSMKSLIAQIIIAILAVILSGGSFIGFLIIGGIGYFLVMPFISEDNQKQKNMEKIFKKLKEETGTEFNEYSGD